MRKRLFIAIELPRELKTELGYIVDQLETIHGLKVVGKDQLHITLAFLGDTDTARITGIKKIMEKVVTLTPPLALTAKSPAIFFDLADLRGIWVPVEITLPLSNLANILRAELINSGLRPDGKPFNAHITLARAKSHIDLDELQKLLKDMAHPPLPSGLANTITLYSSQSTPQGSIYTSEHSKTLD